MRQFDTQDKDVAEGVAIGGAGGVCVAGLTEGSLPGQTNVGGHDAFVRKYDGDGNEIWTRQFGSEVGDHAEAAFDIGVERVARAVELRGFV